MRFCRLPLAALLIALAASPAIAAKVDPAGAIQEALEAYKKNNDYDEVRGILSSALREAAKEGPLAGDFALVYSTYSDVTRASGNPAFALQLAERGLEIALNEDPVDDDAKSLLLVSRAYALADLGRYQDAVEAVRIAVVSVGRIFGPSARKDLEHDAEGWAAKAAAADKNYAIPSFAEVALDQLSKALQALNAGEPEEARAFASRALLPDGVGISPIDLRMMNARCYFALGISFNLEDRAPLAVSQLRRALDLIVETPWDGKSAPQFRKDVLDDLDGPTLIWDVFYNLADSAIKNNDPALASAAMDVAADHAVTPTQRFGVLVLRAGTAFNGNDYEAAERQFEAAAAGARQAGDESNARLADFFVATARLYRAGSARDVPELASLREKAESAAEAAGMDSWTVDYVLSTAVRTAYAYRSRYADVAPLIAQAFDVFVERQRELSGNEESQESERRERRRFLEIVIGASEAEEPSSPASAH